MKTLSREELLSAVKPIAESVSIDVQGFPGKIRVRNISFAEIVKISEENAGDKASTRACIIAAACEDLELEDIQVLLSGNGFKFGALYAAIEELFTINIDEESIKNLPSD